MTAVSSLCVQTRRVLLLLALVLWGLLISQVYAKSAKETNLPPLKVVATFSIIGDMVETIGGDRVEVVTLLGPDGDMHSYEPAPRDVESLLKADLLFANGLNFETWLPRVVASSGFEGELVKVSKGVSPRVLSAEQQLENVAKRVQPDEDSDDDEHDETHAGHHHHLTPGMVDPHAWQSLRNGMIYARNIEKALARVDPSHAADYRERARNYIQRMERLDKRLHEKFAAIPPESRHVITAHDAFGYFADEYEVKFTSLMGLSSEAEPSARGMAALIDAIRRQPGAVIFVERISSPRLVEQIARETGAKIGGTLYSDALGKPDEPGGTYIGMFIWNAGQILFALNPADHPEGLED